jgi:phosphoribosylpyrophosphate synthetase
MVDVAYTIGLGASVYRESARLAVRSLVQHGRFNGDIFVFSDEDIELGGSVRTVLVNDPVCIAQPKWLKVKAPEYIDFNQYERVLFVDGDIITQMPVDDLLQQAGESMVVTDDVHFHLHQGLNSRGSLITSTP